MSGADFYDPLKDGSEQVADEKTKCVKQEVVYVQAAAVGQVLGEFNKGNDENRRNEQQEPVPLFPFQGNAKRNEKDNIGRYVIEGDKRVRISREKEGNGRERDKVDIVCCPIILLVRSKKE